MFRTFVYEDHPPISEGDDDEKGTCFQGRNFGPKVVGSNVVRFHEPHTGSQDGQGQSVL